MRSARRPIARRGSPRQSSQACVGNCHLWTQPNDGENTTLKFWSLEDFPEAWHLRVISSTRTWRRTFWCMVTIFSLWADSEGRKHALGLLRRCIRTEQSGATLGPGPSKSRTASFLGRTLTLRQWRIEYEPDQQHVSRALKALELTGAEGVAAPGTDDVGGTKASQISELLERQNGILGERKMIFSLEKNSKLFQSVAASFKFPCYGQARPLVLSERVNAENGLASYTGPHCPQESCTIHNQIPTNDLQISMDPN